MHLSRRLDPARAAGGGRRGARPKAASLSRPVTATSALRGGETAGIPRNQGEGCQRLRQPPPSSLPPPGFAAAFRLALAPPLTSCHTSCAAGAGGNGSGSSSPGGGGAGAGSSSSRGSGGRAGAASSAASLPFTSGSSSSSGSSGSWNSPSLAALAAPNAIKVYEAGRQGNGKRIVAETVVQAPVDVVRAGLGREAKPASGAPCTQVWLHLAIMARPCTGFEQAPFTAARCRPGSLSLAAASGAHFAAALLPALQVWRVLTNWERLADFVPNLESCERLPSPRPGRVRCCRRCCAAAACPTGGASAALPTSLPRPSLPRLLPPPCCRPGSGSAAAARACCGGWRRRL